MVLPRGAKEKNLWAIEKDDIKAMINLGNYYQKVEKNYDLMKTYYLMAIEKGSRKAMLNLGLYYQIIEPNKKLMEKYFLMAIDEI
jgi:TPR repeat protein